MRRSTPVFAAFLILALAGCGSGYTPKEPSVRLVHRAHTLVFENEGAMPSLEERRKVESFFSGISSLAIEQVQILAPQRGMAPAAAWRRWIVAQGIPAERVVIVPVEAAEIESTTVSLTALVDYSEALPPEGCPDWSGAPPNYTNQVHPNFGCATATNRAAMVADPLDLVKGSGMIPGDADRHQVVITQYKTNEVEQENEESASGGE